MALDPDALVTDLATLLAPAPIDEDRAKLIVELAIQRAAGVVSPVPDAAKPIVLDVALRGYTNPQGVQSQAAGPFSQTFRAPGVYLLDNERNDLAALAESRRGAFTVRMHARPHHVEHRYPPVPERPWP